VTAAAYIGRKPTGSRLWIVPATWRSRWRSAGCRIVRQATSEEAAAAARVYGSGNRPVPLSILDSHAAAAPDVGLSSSTATTVVVIPSDELVLPLHEVMSPRRRRS
jgi:hypothetical protein